MRIRDLKKEILVLKEKRDQINKDIVRIGEEIIRRCKHKNITKNEIYHPGGYLNRSFSQYTITCNNCGKILEKYDGPQG